MPNSNEPTGDLQDAPCWKEHPMADPWIDTRVRLPDPQTLCDVLRDNAYKTHETRRWTGQGWEAVDNPADVLRPRAILCWRGLCNAVLTALEEQGGHT